METGARDGTTTTTRGGGPGHGRVLRDDAPVPDDAGTDHERLPGRCGAARCLAAAWTAQFAAAHVKEAQIAGFEWRQADIQAALAHTRAPVLFIHGEKDTWLSPDHSRDLLKVAPVGSQLVLSPLDTHVSLPLQVAKFAPQVVGWFEAGLQKP